MAADTPLLLFARAGVFWHVVNRAGASLCGAPGPWWEQRPAEETGDGPSCLSCSARVPWLSAPCPVPPHADRAAYRRWVQTEWWLAGGLVFPLAGSAQQAQQEGRA